MERLEDRVLLTFDPTGFEQEMLEHLNRMRTDPQGELDILLSSHPDPLQSNDPDVQAAIDFFQVDGATLETQWASLTAVPALTWDESLYAAAEAHNLEMIAADQQSHQLPGEEGLLTRIVNAGYDWSSSITVGENIYAYAESVFHAHAGFAIDWGNNPPSGIQPGVGHRMNMMSAEFQEVGIRITPETVAATDVGPLVITQDFAADGTTRNAYVLGTVFHDGDDNDRYDDGEGLSNITLTFEDDSGSTSTTSLTAGGYQIALPPGTYTATAAGTGLPVPIQIEGIEVAGQNGISGGVFQNFNVKVDFNAANIPTLSVEVAAPTVTEDAGSTATTAVVTRSGDLTEELVVTLASSNSNKITVPASVVISAGSATSAAFVLDAIDDSALTGDATISVEASATNHIPGSDTLIVTDVETVSMTAPSGIHDSASPQFKWTSVGNVHRYD
ncbi:MAG: CAP domain-containing protein, partial [Planctomycetaceae bacterium]